MNRGENQQEIANQTKTRVQRARSLNLISSHYATAVVERKTIGSGQTGQRLNGEFQDGHKSGRQPTETTVATFGLPRAGLVQLVHTHTHTHIHTQRSPHHHRGRGREPVGWERERERGEPTLTTTAGTAVSLNERSVRSERIVEISVGNFQAHGNLGLSFLKWPKLPRNAFF